MIEAQQRVINLDPAVQPTLLAQDKLGAMYARVMDELIEADGQCEKRHEPTNA